MKKLLAITVVGLLLCSNAYAGLFSKKKYSKSNMPKKVILDVTDDKYSFSETVDQGDGTVRFFRYNVNRYSGVLDLYISVKHVRFGKDAFRKALTTEYTANGICKGVK